MLKFFVFAVVSGGCGAGTPCDVDNVIDEELDRPTTTCGDELVHASGNDSEDSAPYRAAHDCAVAAMQASQPFVLAWTRFFVDTGDRYRFVGYSGGGHYVVKYYDESYAVSGRKRVTGKATSIKASTFARSIR